MSDDQQLPPDIPDPLNDPVTSSTTVPKKTGQRITACLIALVAIPLLMQWCPKEIASWKQASARIAWYNGDQ